MHPKYSPESPLHEASLVDYTLHSPALLELLDIKISKTLIDYIVDCTCEAVDQALSGRRRIRSPELSHPSRKSHRQFVSDLIHRAEVKLPVLLVALVYIDRARAHLEIAVDQYAFERVFLGGVILANKYLNDSTLKNVHWAMCSRIFRSRDIGRIEREFLDVLDFELGVSEADILSHHGSIMSLTHPHRICPSQSVTATSKRNHPNHHISGDRASSEASTLVHEEDQSHSFSVDVDESVGGKSTSPRPHHQSTITRPDIPQSYQGAPLHRARPRVASRPQLAPKPTPYVATAAAEQYHAHRLSIPSALSIFKNFPIFHHSHAHSESPTESTSSSGTTSSASSSSEEEELDGPTSAMSAVAIGF